MKPPGAVRWTQGMLLCPQHFQQSDLFHDAQLNYVAGMIQPFGWGVRHIAIDVDALENEILRILRCELLFPDGLVVRYPDEAVLIEHSFKDSFAPTMEALGVFACVRALGERDGAVDRYATRGEQRRDFFDAESEAPVEYVVPRITLVFTNNPEDGRLTGFQALKVAEVRRTGRAAPRYELSRRYIPPVVRAAASPVLDTTVRQVHDQLCAASRVLGQRRRERGGEGLAAGAGDIEHLLSLQMLNQFVPVLQHTLTHGGGHPFALYSLLAQLRGALTTYHPDEDPVTFPDYDHADLAGCFLPLAESIRRLLERLLPTHYEEIQMEREGFTFWAALDDDLLREGTGFVLAIRGTGTTEELRRRIEGQAKISSTDDMRKLVTMATRGVPTRFLEQPPAEIPRYADHSYFAIETGDPRWRNVREAGDLSFYLAEAEAELAVRLFVVLPRGRKS